MQALAGLVWAALGGLALAGAASSSSPSAALYPNSPLVLWSDRPIFNGRNAYSGAPMDQGDVASALAMAAKRGRNSDPWGIVGEQRTPFAPAELLCVFLLPSLGTDELARLAAPGGSSFVQQAVLSAASSIVVPHTTRSRPLREALAAAPAVASGELEAFVAEGGSWHALLADGKTDVVVVEIAGDLADADAAIRAAAGALAKATQGLTDFALAGDNAGPVTAANRRRLAAQTAAASVVCEAGYLVGYSAAGTAFCFSHFVHMTPDVLTGIVFGLFFLALAYVGLSVLHAIQTPLKYPLHGPPRGKEF